MSNIPSILDDAKFRQLVLQDLNNIITGTTNITGFSLPPYDKVELSNYIAADKPGTILLKSSGSVVATLTLSYDGSDNLTSITRS